MAQIAKTTTVRTIANDPADNLAELRRRTAQQGADVAHEVADRAEDATRTVQRAAGAVAEVERAVAHQAAAGTTKLGRAFLELANEQAQHNLETLKALSGAVDWTRFAKAVDWSRVFEIQRAYLRASLERTARLTQSYLEVGQATTAATASAARRQAQKAA